MTSIVDGAIGRARMVIAILLCAIIAGTVTYVKLPKEADPDIPIPFVVVTVPLAGVTPEDAERLLVRPIEQEIQSIEGLKTFKSYGSEGAGTLVLEFEIDVDVDQAVLDVKDKVDLAKRFFPQDAREPVIQEFNASQFPVMVVNLYGEAPVRGLNKIAEDLQDKLERNAGILEARIQGQREDVLEIVVDPAKLETYNISYQEIYSVVTANNQLVPAGEIDTGEGSFAVKVPGLIRTAQDALNLPIKRTENAVVTLQDVADKPGIAAAVFGPLAAAAVVRVGGETTKPDAEELEAKAEEAIALAGIQGFAPPASIRADRIFVDGTALRFSDVTEAGLAPLSTDFAAINGTAGALTGSMHVSIPSCLKQLTPSLDLLC